MVSKWPKRKIKLPGRGRIPCLLFWPSLALSTCLVGFLVNVAHAQLIFYKAYEEKDLPFAGRASLRKVVVPSLSGGTDVFVEQKASLEIPLTEIQHVVIREAHPNDDMTTLLNRMARATKKRGVPSGRAAARYEIVIALFENGGNKLRQLSRVEAGRMIDVWMGSRRISVALFQEPIQENGFGISCQSSPDELRRIFAPVRNKLWWEE